MILPTASAAIDPNRFFVCCARVARLAEHTLAKRFSYEPVAISRQFFEQIPCFFQIGGRETLGEAVINWCQKPNRFFATSLGRATVAEGWLRRVVPKIGRLAGAPGRAPVGNAPRPPLRLLASLARA
jgi:hypothetical protein